MSRITSCPQCGGRLQATVVRYLDDVQLDDEDRHIVAYSVADENDPDGYAWSASSAEVYCENDHPVSEWRAPLSAGSGLGGYIGSEDYDEAER